jgi:4-carboxymuconolactone decarboxylase
MRLEPRLPISELRTAAHLFWNSQAGRVTFAEHLGRDYPVDRRNGVTLMAPGKEPRFPQLTMEQLNDTQRPLGEQIMKVSRVGLGGPYNPMLRSPVFGQKMFDLLYYLRWQTSVPLKLNEFAILIIGRQWRSQVEWFAHAPLAIKAGLSPDIVAELKTGKRPSNMPAEEAIVYDFVSEIDDDPSGF